MVEPPIFCYTKFNFYVLFQQVNATATRFTHFHYMIFSKFIELNKFSQSILNYVGYTISSTFKYSDFNFILHTILSINTNVLPNNFIFLILRFSSSVIELWTGRASNGPGRADILINYNGPGRAGPNIRTGQAVLESSGPSNNWQVF